MLVFIAVFAGAAWIVALGVVALAVALGGYILLGTTTTVRCDLAGFAIERRNRLKILSATSHRWANVTALHYSDWQSTTREGKKRLTATFTVEVSYETRFRFPGELDGFGELIEIRSTRCTHLPYTWSRNTQATGHPALAHNIAYRKVVRDIR